MKNIDIPINEETPYFPKVSFNAEEGLCEIAGESYMEETYKFYLPLISWLKEYIEEVKKPIEFNIKLVYLNTSSSKCILDMFEILKVYEEQGGKVNVSWYYDKDDPDMVEEVEDFEAESGLDIKIIETEYN